MIKVRMVSGFIADEVYSRIPVQLVGDVNCYMNTDGKKPAQVFDAMIDLGIDWEIQYDEATDSECSEWAINDVVCRKVRAQKLGKTIIFEGEPISYDEFQDKLLEYMTAHSSVPDVIADNSLTYILGTAETEGEA